MKPYGIAKKSKMNFWDSNVCHCELCNAKNRKDIRRKERNKNKVNMLKFDDSS